MGSLTFVRPVVEPVLRGIGLYGPVRQAYRWTKRTYRGRRIADEEVLNAELVPEAQLKQKLREALSLLSDDGMRASLGDYLEFGVFNGRSMACMYDVAAERGLGGMRFFGFDSFKGLPLTADSDDEGAWRPGAYGCPRRVTEALLDGRGVDWNRVFLVEGWFEDTLKPETARKHGIEKASVIMVDCDLYSSAACALRFAGPFIRDRAVILFDDWYSAGLDRRNLGEKKAFMEFLAANTGLQSTEIGSYGKNSLIFLVARRP